MSQTLHMNKIEEWCAEQEALRCKCGGEIVVGHTVPRPVATEGGFMWESMAHISCKKCGTGYAEMITQRDNAICPVSDS